ncbi:PQQ-binding-like beta-propeller repeat protein [Kitasatospora aureofaciens]|uniref:outer membrane protein assembly factor BamB family protein n=1 Tax=Kitasatospora aureofaciens TaxID=1894 RepID=UPI0033D9B3F7
MAAAAVVLAAGCASGAAVGGGGIPASGAAAASPAVPSSTPSPTPKGYDPPTKFSKGRFSKPLPEKTRATDVLLDGTTYYIADDIGLVANALYGHDEVGVANATHPGNLHSPPVLAQTGDKRVVLTAVRMVIPGQGTSVDRTGVELVALSTSKGSDSWTVPIDLPQDYTGIRSLTVLGVRGTTAVIAGADADHGLVWAVDLPTKKVLWTQKGFTGAQLTDDQVVGLTSPEYTKHQVSALKIADGSTAWTAEQTYDLLDTTLTPAGPNRVAIQGNSFVGFKSSAWILDSTTGKQIFEFSGGSTPFGCAYDERSVTVCADKDLAFAFDTASGKTLWRLPDDAKTRIAPRVSTAWHGVVYGTTSRGPVALDAVTGQDLPSPPTLAPLLVDNYMSIGSPDTDGTALSVYPAIG